jgi:hypothetical protein
MKMSNIERRLSKLENATGTGNDGPDNLIIHLSWGDSEEADKSYDVDGECMSMAEFNRRWPDYQMGDDYEIKLSWGDD